MKRHDWKLQSIDKGKRTFKCANCPLEISIPESSSKGAISYFVKQQGLTMDCNVEKIRKTMEE